MKGEIELLPSVLSFYQSFLSGLKLYPIFPEHRISLDLGWKLATWESGWFRCVLDLKLVDGTGIVLYDWKTGKMYDDHFEQKELYALACFGESEEVKRVRAIHVYLDLNKSTERTYERSDMPLRLERWKTRVAKMEADTSFIPNPSWKCRFCSFSKFKGGPCQF